MDKREQSSTCSIVIPSTINCVIRIKLIKELESSSITGKRIKGAILILMTSTSLHKVLESNQIAAWASISAIYILKLLNAEILPIATITESRTFLSAERPRELGTSFTGGRHETICLLLKASFICCHGEVTGALDMRRPKNEI